MKDLPRAKSCYYCERPIPPNQEVTLQWAMGGDVRIKHKDCPKKEKKRTKVKLIKRAA